MPNRRQGPLAVVEDDMATRADAHLALQDLEGLMLRLAHRPAVTLADIDRLSDDCRRIRSGLECVQKYLIEIRGST